MSDRKGGLAGILLVALLLLSAGGAGVALWRWRAGPEVEAPVLSVEQYVSLRDRGLVREVWMQGPELEVELHAGFPIGDRDYKWVKVLLTPGDLRAREGIEYLKRNLPPERFHVSPP
jgi:hypothetical protein